MFEVDEEDAGDGYDFDLPPQSQPSLRSERKVVAEEFEEVEEAAAALAPRPAAATAAAAMFEVDEADAGDAYDVDLPLQSQPVSFSRPERKVVAPETEEDERQARRGDDDAYDVDIAEDISAPLDAGAGLAVEALPAPEAYPAEQTEEVGEAAARWSEAAEAAPGGSGGRGSSDHSAEFGPAFGAAEAVRGGAVADDTEQLSLGGDESSVDDYF